jgi:parallel beta-helix repeat protein
MKIKIILISYIIMNAAYLSAIQSTTARLNAENDKYYSTFKIPLSKSLPNDAISEIITCTNENSVTAHPPIRIIGNNGFTKKNGVSGGNGDKDNPYIIEQWKIQGTPFWTFINRFLHVLEHSRLDNRLVYFVNIPICGIYLKDTTKHVIIRNNNIFNWTGTQRDFLPIAGITLINASNVTIVGNTFYNNFQGVSIPNIQWILKKFENYTMKFGQSYNSTFLSIQNNTFFSNEEALVLCSTTKSQILRNTFSQNGCGIRSTTSNVSIEQNQIISNGNGILCTQTDFSTITNNTIQSNGNGIYCAESGSDQIGSNPKITDNSITGNGAGIFICTNYPVITNNSIIDNKFGIMNMDFSDLPVIIVDNEIKENDYGIDYYGSCIIEHNLVTLNDEGISIRGNASVNQNIVSSNNGNGISCGSANIQGYEMSPTIHYNNIMNNTKMGIHWKTSSTSIDATYNYWGSSDGPGGYGPGTGDEVDLHIIFEPWLTEVNQQAGPR